LPRESRAVSAECDDRGLQNLAVGAFDEYLVGVEADGNERAEAELAGTVATAGLRMYSPM